MASSTSNKPLIYRFINVVVKVNCIIELLKDYRVFKFFQLLLDCVTVI